MAQNFSGEITIPLSGSSPGVTTMVRPFDTGMRIRRILFATDFSRAAQAALSHAVRLARLSQAQLYIGHVIKSRPWEVTSQLTLRRRIDATRRLDQILTSTECAGIRPLPVTRHGAVVTQLLGIAEDHAVDLIVTGGSSRGLSRLCFRSKAEELAQRAPCPVLIVGPHAAAASNGEGGFRNIVLAAAMNPAAAVAIRYARSFARRHGARLWVAHSLPLREASLRRDSADAWLKKIVPDEPGVARVLQTGSVEQVTLMMAERESADLVMLAPGIGESLPRILRHAACPVMAVRYAIPMVRPKTRAATPALGS